MTGTKPPVQHKATRDERLAARLRENLKRRKAQARALDGAIEEGGHSEGEQHADSADSLESGLSKTTG